jgi:hypothetical protein
MPDDRVDDSHTTLWPLPCEVKNGPLHGAVPRGLPRSIPQFSCPLGTAVIRWSMPQSCPKIPTLASSPYIFSRGAGWLLRIQELPASRRVRALSPIAIRRDRARPG